MNKRSFDQYFVCQDTIVLNEHVLYIVTYNTFVPFYYIPRQQDNCY